jgi:hypothetical protein
VGIISSMHISITTFVLRICFIINLSSSLILLQVPNNYETDLIYPIIEKAAELANISYALADDRTKMNLKVH